ncbi:MAG: hypothetical protein ABIU54_05295, partial [Candidatus Eisenbacteria bacterium]
LARARVRIGQPSLGRPLVHRLFLRELRDYRDCIAPSTALASHPAPEVRLLGESYSESAEMALERAMNALACWYEPDPLVGVLDRIRSGDRHLAAPALDFLEHILPRPIFSVVRKIFEDPTPEEPDAEAEPDPIAQWIETAWTSDDTWLRACAVRASRFSPSFDARRFTIEADAHPFVLAEIAALVSPGTPSTNPTSRAAIC